MKGSTKGSPPTTELPSDVKTLLAEFLKRSKALRQESSSGLKTAFDGEGSLPALLQFVHDASSTLSNHEKGIIRQQRTIYEYAAASEDIAKTTTMSDNFQGFNPPVALNHERNTISMQSRILTVQERIAKLREILDSSSVEKAQEIQQKMSDLQSQLEALERFSDLAHQVNALRSRIVSISPVKKKNTQRRSSGRVGLVFDSDDDNTDVTALDDLDEDLTDLTKAVEIRASLNPFREQTSRPAIVSSSSFNMHRQSSNSTNKRAMLSRQPSSSSAAPSSRNLHLQQQQQLQRNQLGRRHWQRSAQALRSETRPCYSLPLYLHLDSEDQDQDQDQESETMYVQARRRFCAVQALPWQTHHNANQPNNAPNISAHASSSSTGPLHEDFGRLIDAHTLTAASSSISSSTSVSSRKINSNKDTNAVAESTQLSTLCASLETSILSRIAYVYKVELPPPPPPVAPPVAPPSAPLAASKSAEPAGDSAQAGAGDVLRSPNRDRSRSSLTEPPPLPLPQPSTSTAPSTTSSNATAVTAPSATTSASASGASSVPASIASQSALRPANTLSATECIEEVRLIFATYNAERLTKLSKLLEKYVNKEHDLLRAVRDKYVPKDSAGASSNNTSSAVTNTATTAFGAKAVSGFGTPTPFGAPSSSTAAGAAKPAAATTTAAAGGLASGFGQGWSTSSSTASSATANTSSLFGNKPAAASTSTPAGGAFGGLGFGANTNTANNNLTPVKGTSSSVFGAPSSSTSLSTPSTTTATSSAFGQGWGTPSAASSTSSSSAALSVAQIQARVTQIYQTHNPQKLGEIGGLFEKYRGRESELLQRIEAKYNAGSTTTTTPAPATTGGGFGAANANATSAFGLKSNTPNNNTSAASAFGASTGGGFGGGFGATAGNTPFGTTSTSSATGFGLGSGAKPAFGATPTPFGAPSSSSSSTLPLAPALSTPFGQTAATTPGGGSAFNTSAFGAGFGASPAATTSLFSSPTAAAQTPAATTFGSPSTLNTSLFGARPGAAGTPMTQPSPGFGAVATSLFRH